ncbi:MFS transporter, CP family, cyanate transporter [Ruaniaceae bacterium KH17]|nr:MFS transporter, CP family, cyanate transporter [Ruaniaceae bacterium KH17]
MKRQVRWQSAFLVFAILTLAINLRPGATSIGPVLQEMRESLAMSASGAGLLTALPGLVFAIVGLTATLFARRLGLTGALILASSAIAVGLIIRPFLSNVPLFFVLTIVALAGMSIGNVLAPPFIRSNFPYRTAAVTTVYTTGIAIGGALPPLLSAPIAQATDWRYALVLWGISGLLAFVVWIGVGRINRGRGRKPVARAAAAVPVVALFRSPKAIALAIFFGMQSMQAYVQFAWVPQMFRDGGLSATYAGTLLSVIPALGIIGAFLMPTVVDKMRNPAPVVLVLAGLLVLGYLGILYFPTTMPLLWVIALGLSGSCFQMAIALINARSRDISVTVPLSTLTQSIGYTFSAIGPFALGLLYESTGAWDVPLWILIGSGVVLAISGIYAARPGYVDDELRLG